MSKILDAEGLAEARAWLARFLQGRSPEEKERIKNFLQVTFPPPSRPRSNRGSSAPDATPKSPVRSKRRSK